MIKKIIIGIIFFILYCLIFIFVDEILAIILLKFGVFILFLNFIVYVKEKSNLKDIDNNLKYVKSSPKRLYSIFNWLGEEMDSDRIIYEIVGDIIDKPSTIETIQEVKRHIKSKIGDEKGDYYLIRELLRNSNKHNFGEYFNRTFTIILGTVGTVVITSFLKDIKMPKEMNLDVYSEIITIIIYIFVVLGGLIMIHQTFSKSKRRANMVLMILDEIIREKEENM